jgi:hypothetical protein
MLYCTVLCGTISSTSDDGNVRGEERHAGYSMFTAFLLRSQVYTYAVMSALYSYGRCQQRTNSKQRSRSHGPI